MTPQDEAHRLTDAELAKLERRVERVYQDARDDLQKTVDDYFARFQERDAEMKALIGTVQNGREWTVNDYKQWRLNQIARGKRFEALRDKMAERYTEANETAMSYVNDKTPGIYSLNRNYGAYTIDRTTGGALTMGGDGETLNADFILYDEQTVRRLIVEEPDVMPYYPPERAVQRGIDLAYGKSQITKNVTSGILRGLSIKQMSDGLQERIQTMERNSAIRAARTAVTAAQNAGRMDSYRAAQDMGIKLKKRWLATLDGRTRHSHRRLDGETRDTDEAFSNGCMYPGDPRGVPAETYNCRCTLIASLPDFDLSPGQRRARDPVTGDSVVIDYTTYPKWMESLKTQHGEKTVDIALKKAHNEIADKEQHKVYRKLLGNEIPTSFQDFQNLKYEHPKKWAELKDLKQQLNTQKEGLTNSEKGVIAQAENVDALQNKKLLLERISSGDITYKLNDATQAPHMEATRKPGKSYFTISQEELQRIVDELHGTGKIRVTPNGQQIRETLTCDYDIGYVVDSENGTEAKTNRFTIHYSKRRTHAVPSRRVENEQSP